MLALMTAALLAATGCEPLPGVDAIVSNPDTHFVLIGEYHGTVEMPAVAASALCAAAQAKRPAVLGVEFPTDMQPALDAYFVSNGDVGARDRLLSHSAWAEPGGRTTVAILDMIDGARRLKAAGHAVTVVAFDSVPAPMVSREREAGLAASLAAAQARTPGSLVVALTGAGHAGKSDWTSQTPPFASAGKLLPQANTVALTFARPGGHYWGCAAPDGDATGGCKAYDMPVREPAGPRGIRLDPSLRAGFDGLYSSGGQYSASKPACG